MADHAEEQEMEAEAMAAIFDSHFEVLEAKKWSVTIYPESGDPSELDTLNHVGCKLLVNLPEMYPEVCPELDIEIVKGLAEEQRLELKKLADEEATANQGVPSLFAVTERLREWLLENNVKGLDDVSMHAQMMRKKLQAEKSQVRCIPTVVFNNVGLQATLRSNFPRSLEIQQYARV
jgi:RWD domain